MVVTKVTWSFTQGNISIIGIALHDNIVADFFFENLFTSQKKSLNVFMRLSLLLKILKYLWWLRN